MQSHSSASGTFFGLILLFALLAGAYYFFAYVAEVFSALEAPIGTLAAIGSAVMLLSAVIVAEGFKARRANGSHAAPRNVYVYERLLALCCDRGQSPRATDVRAAADLAATEQLLVLHGSADVVSAYARLARASDGDLSEDDRQRLLEALVAGMRKDLGKHALHRKEVGLLELFGRPSHASNAAGLVNESVAHE